jgi:hypothetical protein
MRENTDPDFFLQLYYQDNNETIENYEEIHQGEPSNQNNDDIGEDIGDNQNISQIRGEFIFSVNDRPKRNKKPNPKYFL